MVPTLSRLLLLLLFFSDIHRAATDAASFSSEEQQQNLQQESSRSPPAVSLLETERAASNPTEEQDMAAKAVRRSREALRQVSNKRLGVSSDGIRKQSLRQRRRREQEVSSEQSNNNQQEDEQEEQMIASSRVIGGQLALNSGRTFPWFVHMGRCGASLVAEDVVMTAAHCIPTIGSRVLVGAVYENDENVGDAQFRDVYRSTIIAHKDYSTTTQQYDFALFKIERVTKSHLRPIELNTNVNTPSTGDTVTVCGMGAINKAGTKYKDDLQYVDVGVINPSKCANAYGGAVYKESMLCAGVTSGTPRDSCYGDSGGPLVTRNNVQVGVVSWGAECGDKNFPGVYARVSGAIDWLHKNICELSDTNPSFCNNSNNGFGSSGNSTGSSSYGNGNVSGSSSVNSGVGQSEADEGEGNSSGFGGGYGVLRFFVSVQYDKNPAELQVSVLDAETDESLVRFPRGNRRSNTMKTKEVANMQGGRKYLVVMEDKRGNGFCCNQGKKGFVRLFAKNSSGRRIWNKKIYGKFKSKKAIRTVAIPSSL